MWKRQRDPGEERRDIEGENEEWRTYGRHTWPQCLPNW